VLLASVRNLTYPITVDIFHQLFSRFGQVQRIATFMKGDKLQALIEMATPEQAQEAQSKLDQQEIYAGCCFLTVNFSNRDTVVVKPDSNRGR